MVDTVAAFAEKLQSTTMIADGKGRAASLIAGKKSKKRFLHQTNLPSTQELEEQSKDEQIAFLK